MIDNFFLKPIRNFDFAGFDTQSLRDSRSLLAESYDELPGAVEAAGIDLARYFALFFEAFSRLEDFREEIRAYYARAAEKPRPTQLRATTRLSPRVAENHAVNVIASLEGRLFLERGVRRRRVIGPLLRPERRTSAPTRRASSGSPFSRTCPAT